MDIMPAMDSVADLLYVRCPRLWKTWPWVQVIFPILGKGTGKKLTSIALSEACIGPVACALRFGVL